MDNPTSWLTTVTARICLDRLRKRRSRREDLVDSETTASIPSAAEDHDPEDALLVAESIGDALLVVLDSLAPAERVAFVLHDVFAVPFDEISKIVGRSPDATRQLASRARRRVQGNAPTTAVDLVRHRDIVDAFLRAARHGEFEELLQLLDPDVVMLPDVAATPVAEALSGGAQASCLK